MDTTDLETWYTAYANADASTLAFNSDVVQAVLSDNLDHASIKTRVQRYILTTKVDEVDRLCRKCLRLIRYWPDLLSQTAWTETIVCGLDTKELEAGSHCRCRFCHYLFFLIEKAELTGMYRKIEARLRKLGVRQTTSLSIQTQSLPRLDGFERLWI